MTTSIKKLILGDQGLLVIFILAFALVSLTVPNFLTERNMLGLLQSVVTVGVIACTMMFCLAARDFDLSVGSNVAFCGMVAVMASNATGSIFLGILTALAAGALVGLFNGVVIAKFRINALITTLATMQIVRGLDSDTVIMTPDKYLAQNIANLVPEKNIVWWDGACIVHEQYTAQDLKDFREWNPGTRIIAHPECPPDVVAEADFSGSTSGIIDYVTQQRPEKAMLVTECSMASNISDALPDVDFVGPCNMCPYMKKITLEKVLWSLHTMEGAVEIDPQVADKARVAVQRMIDLSAKMAG